MAFIRVACAPIASFELLPTSRESVMTTCQARFAYPPSAFMTRWSGAACLAWQRSVVQMDGFGTN